MTDASVYLRELSEPWPSGDRIKVAIGRAASAAGLSYWRAFDIWYGKARRVEDYENQQIAEAIRIKRERAAGNELHELKLRLARLEAALAAGSTNFHSPMPDRARDGVRGAGRTDRSVAGGRGR